MPPLSVTIITLDEAEHLPGALDSVAWADEIVIVDSGSRDETVAIARRATGRVVVRPWSGYAAQKNAAAELATHDWILSLDADERVSPPLADEIRRRLASEPVERGFRIPRAAHYLGRWIRSTDWYPDYQLRLYHRRAAAWKRTRVHESVAVDGMIGVLSGELHHLPYRSVSEHLATIDRYTSLAALDLRERGARAGPLGLLCRPPLAFLRNYVLRRGFVDGAPGLIVSLLNSYYVFLKFVKLWELRAAVIEPDPASAASHVAGGPAPSP